MRETVDALTQTVVRALVRSRPGGGTFHIEDVQDHVELGLMRSGHHEVARAYVLYRERRTQERAQQVQAAQPAEAVLHVVDGGQRVPLDIARLQSLIEAACANLGKDVKADPIVAETKRRPLFLVGALHGFDERGAGPSVVHLETAVAARGNY